MSHQLTDQVKLLQKAVLTVGEEFLILKRSSLSHTRANSWDLPGGNSEWPTNVTNLVNLHQADLIREIEEETGIKFDSSQIGNQPVYFGTYFEKQKQLYTMIVGWKLELSAKPAVKLSDEHTEFAWIKSNEFDHFDFGFAGEEFGFIRQIVANAFNFS